MNEQLSYIVSDYDNPAADRELAEQIAASRRRIIVLDDDPTGIQTVHDVPVYTDWEEESIARGFAGEQPMFYILTNSRSFTAEQTTQCHRQIIRRIIKAADEARQDFLIISRGDSTLRGHYPLETELLREGLEAAGRPVDGEIICPFFAEGGRYTIGNIHYVRQGDELIPAGETEFAGDRTFGYHSSNLRDYIEEKTGGAYPAADVTAISLGDLRSGNIDRITEQLMQVENFNKIIVNAAGYGDLRVFMTALYRALNAGRRFLYRTAASFVKVIGGITDRPLLTRGEMVVRENENGGIVVVGSHTAKTTAQLERLKELPGLQFIEFDSDLVLKEHIFRAEVIRVQEQAEACISMGRTAVIYTRRKVLDLNDDTKEAALQRSVKISDAVQSFVGNLRAEPEFIVAKGGITSSDIGTKALQVKRARVLGQIRPGVPVWQTGAESRFPQIPYVIFPGNVGEDATLKEVVETLLGE